MAMTNYDRAQDLCSDAAMRWGRNLSHVNSCVNQVTAALVSAAEQYNQIMQAKRSVPLMEMIGDIAINIVIVALPLAGTAAGFAKTAGTVKKMSDETRNSLKAAQAALERWDRIPGTASKIISTGKSAVGAFKPTSDHGASPVISRSIPNQLLHKEAGKWLDLANNAQLMTEAWISAITKLRDAVGHASTTQEELRGITALQNGIIEAEQHLKTSGLYPMKPVGAGEMQKIANQYVYNMLNMYTKANVTFYLDKKTYPATQDLPDQLDERFVRGLNDNQRRAIYDMFGAGGRGRSQLGAIEFPQIDSYKDLIKYWGANTFFYDSQKFQSLDANKIFSNIKVPIGNVRQRMS